MRRWVIDIIVALFEYYRHDDHDEHCIDRLIDLAYASKHAVVVLVFYERVACCWWSRRRT